MNPKIEAAFNDHLNAEFYSAYLYLSMANYFAAKNLEGMSTWMRVQEGEERLHGMKFLDYIQNRGGRVLLQQINQPQTDWKSPLEAFQEALEHERFITSRINALADLSIKENDHAAGTFLQWFISEQVEEESVAQRIVEQLKLVGDNPVGVLFLDNQLGQRTAAPAAAPAE